MAKPVHLICPECKKAHIDEGPWALRPHKTHRCVDDGAGKGCGHEWEAARRCISTEPGRVPAVIEKTFNMPAPHLSEEERIAKVVTAIVGFQSQGGLLLSARRVRNPAYDRGKERTSFQFVVAYHGTMPE